MKNYFNFLLSRCVCLSLSLFEHIFWRFSWYSFLAALMLVTRSMLVPFYNSGPNMNTDPTP